MLFRSGDLPSDAALPVREHSAAGGARLLMPHDPERLLSLNYGEGWRVPDPLFQFDWPGARERFATFVELLESTTFVVPGAEDDEGAAIDGPDED